MDQDDLIPPTVTADVTIDASHEPALARKWNAMLRKHGSAANAIHALLPLHEEHDMYGEIDPDIYDLTDSTIVSMRISKSILRDIQRAAELKGVSVEQEMAARLGFDMASKDTVL